MELILLALLLVAALAIFVLLMVNIQLSERANTAERKAMGSASQYIKQEVKRLRADAIKKSTAVVTGKVAEWLTPFRTGFDYNPRDARFLGSPVDFLVFEGLTEGDLDRVIFIEVKTGKSRLSRRERQLRDVIDAGEVYWEEIRHESPSKT